MRAYLQGLGFKINRKRLQGLYRLLGIEAVYPKPNLSKSAQQPRIYPYLLKDVAIIGPNHVWSTDLTYIRMYKGFMYLMAIIDWYSRYVLAWTLSPTLEADFCIELLEEVLSKGCPEIFNTDQGSQFTSSGFTDVLSKQGIQISMDGKGRALDNIFVERL